ncbi:MAG: AsmA family protein, partial [Verrucomicrobiia bacterium]
AVGIIILVVGAYFVLTSPAFIKGVALPRLGGALHASITVSDVSLNPFKQIVLRDLKVRAKGRAPVLTVSEVSVRYHLWDILRGHLRVDDIALISPAVELVKDPDGSSNLDPLLKVLQGKPAEAGTSKLATPTKAPRIDLGQLSLRNASIVEIKNYAGGRSSVLVLTNLDLTLSNVKNGQSAALQLTADLRIDSHPPGGTNGFLAAAITGNFNVALAEDLKPVSTSGAAQLAVSSAGGALQNFSGFSAALNCDITPAEIKQVRLHFQNDGVPMGELAVSGPLDLETMDGRLRVELTGIDNRLLNLAGATSGIDFGPTTINSTNEITLANAGMVMAATGLFTADKVQLTRAGLTTPALDFNARYNVTVDRTKQDAVLHELTLTGTQNGRPLLDAHLTRPMSVAWGTGAGGVGESALDLNVTNLDLADWKPFFGAKAPGGDVNLQAQLLSQQDGKRLAFELNSQIANFTAPLDSNRTIQVAVSLQAQGQAVNFQQFNLKKYRLQITRQNQPLVAVSGSGAYDLASASADTQVALQASLPALSQILSAPEVNISSGTIELNGHVTQKQNTQTVTGDLALADFTGRIGKNAFHNFGSALTLNVAKTTDQIQIHKVAGKLTQDGNDGGAFDLAGSYDLSDKSAQLTAQLSDFNENGLRPFLEPLLADKKLVSVFLNGNATVQYEPDDNASVQADLQVTNLVVDDQKLQFPKTPLAAGLKIDVAMQKQTADIHEFQIGLTPTQRAQNQVQLQGNVDFSKNNAIQGQLKLAADSLDLTSYYDLFAGGAKTAGKTAPATPSASPVPAAAGQEPPAMNLPLQNFTLMADIGQLYLHEVAITNFQTTINVNGGHVRVKPFQLALNGAPVNASVDLDLSVPGYKYNFALDADRVPFAPLVDTFAPDRQGQLGGTLTAYTQIAGAGTTGANLKRNLTGQFEVDTTNLNLSVINVRSPILKTLINVVATVPQLLSNPETAIASLLGRVTGLSSGGLMNQLQQAPIETINAQGRAGNGQINLQSAVVQSAAFEADASGVINLAPVLTNSTINIPITVSLSQSIASQLNLAAANTTTGAAYVPLPQFLTMKQTLGDPKAEIKKLALAGIAVKSVGNSLTQPASGNSSPVGTFLNQLLRQVK